MLLRVYGRLCQALWTTRPVSPPLRSLPVVPSADGSVRARTTGTGHHQDRQESICLVLLIRPSFPCSLPLFRRSPHRLIRLEICCFPAEEKIASFSPILIPRMPSPFAMTLQLANDMPGRILLSMWYHTNEAGNVICLRTRSQCLCRSIRFAYLLFPVFSDCASNSQPVQVPTVEAQRSVLTTGLF